MKKAIAILIALVVLSTSVFAASKTVGGQSINSTSSSIQLKTGLEIMNLIKANSTARQNVTTVVFGASASSVTSKSLSWLGWADTNGKYCGLFYCSDNTTIYFVTYSGNETLKFNADSSQMFYFANIKSSSGGEQSNGTYACSKLANIEIPGKIDTSVVTNMSYMFEKTKLSDEALATFLSKADLGNVVKFYSTFKGVTTLTTADFSNEDMGQACDMGHMFDGCSSLTTVKFPTDPANWMHADIIPEDATRAASRKYHDMQTNSDGLGPDKDKDGNYKIVESGVTEKRPMATNLGQMFLNCTALKTIDLTGIATSEYTEPYYMFKGCSKLESVFAPEGFKVKLLKDEAMFVGCNNLVSYEVDENYNIVAVKKYSSKDDPANGVVDLSNSFMSQATPWVTLSGSLVLDGTIHVNLGADFGCFNATKINLEYADYLTNASGAERVKDSENLVANEQYSVNVAAAQMTQVIDVEIPIANGKSATRNTSVKAMADAAIDSVKGAKDDKSKALVNLCKAMLDYGAYAQKYFKVDTSNLANATNSIGTLADPDFSGMQTVIEYTFDGKAANTTPGDANNIQTLTAGENFNARFYGNSLVCYSSMCTRHSFALPEGASFGFDKSAAYKVDVKASDGTSLNDRVTFGTNTDSGVTRCYIQVNDFAAARIDDSYTVTVICKATGKAMTIKYSPMCYISGVLNSTDAAGASAEQKADLANLKNLVKAIYQYNSKANAYFDNYN